MISNPSIDFAVLKGKARLWGQRYPEITQIRFFNTISGHRPYILLFSISDFYPDSKYVGRIGMGFSFSEDTPEQRELSECFSGKLDQFEVYTEAECPIDYRNEKSASTFIGEKWFGDNSQLNKSQFNQIVFTESEITLFLKNCNNNQAEIELKRVIAQITPEVDTLYKGIKTSLKAQRLTLSNSDRNQQIKACQKYYDSTHSSFYMLKKDHIYDDERYWATNNSARDIIGGMLEQYLIGEHNHLATDKNLKTNYQQLYSLSRKLLKTI